MEHRLKIMFFMSLIGLFFKFVDPGWTQIKNEKIVPVVIRDNVDTVKTGPVSTLKNVEDEIELSEINIEAVVEKPRVAILPKRLDPEFGEMELINRSFENELKKTPEQPIMLDDRLLVPKKIENLKEKLIQKKKDLDQK